MEIKNIFKETIPKSRLIGKCYTDNDRVDGGFGHKWCEFFGNGSFDILEKAGGKADFDYLGMMRVVNGVFEYWVGMLAEPGTAPPEGFECAEVDTFDAAVFWFYGKEDSGELFGMEPHNRALAEITAKGWKRREDGWCIERYNCPRYTTPDEFGNVILDYYVEVE